VLEVEVVEVVHAPQVEEVEDDEEELDEVHAGQVELVELEELELVEEVQPSAHPVVAAAEPARATEATTAENFILIFGVGFGGGFWD